MIRPLPARREPGLTQHDAGLRPGRAGGLLQPLFRRKGWFLGATLLAGMIVGWLILSAPVTYRSTALVTLGGGLRGAATSAANSDDRLSAMQALRSDELRQIALDDPLIARGLVAECEARRVATLRARLIAAWRHDPSCASAMRDRSTASELLSRMITVQPGAQSNVVAIGAASPVATDAALFANVLANLLVTEHARLEHSADETAAGRFRAAITYLGETLQQIDELASAIRGVPDQRAGRSADFLARVANRLAAIQARRAAALSRVERGGTVQRDLDTAEAQISALDAQLAGVPRTAAGRAAGDNLLAVLTENAELRRLIVADLSRKLDELEVRRRVPQDGPQLLSAASIPAGPGLDERSALLVAGTVLALFTGGMVAIVGRRWRTPRPDGTVMQVADVAQVVPEPDLPVAGYMPRLQSVAEVLGGVRETEDTVVLEDAMRSVFAHAVLPRDPMPRVVLVASGDPREGRTALALALARFVARSGHRVVLVEGDLRHPCFEALLGLPQQAGLGDHLAGAAELSGIVRPGGVNLPDVIPAGLPASRDPMALSGSRLAGLLAQLRDAYDLVLIDSPPVRSAPDAAILGQYVDGLLACARWGVADAVSVLAGLGPLGAGPAPLLGVVVGPPPGQPATFQDRPASEPTA